MCQLYIWTFVSTNSCEQLWFLSDFYSLIWMLLLNIYPTRRKYQTATQHNWKPFISKGNNKDDNKTRIVSKTKKIQKLNCDREPTTIRKILVQLQFECVYLVLMRVLWIIQYFSCGRKKRQQQQQRAVCERAIKMAHVHRFSGSTV